jgi:PASTA domain-containing protein
LKKLVLLFAFLLVGVASATPSVVSTTETAATVEGLDCGSKYRIEIQRYAENGELSSTADAVDAQTTSCPDTQPPSAPQDLAATGQTETSISAPGSATGQTETSISVPGSPSTQTVGVARCAVPDVRRRTVTMARAMLSARRCRLGRTTPAYSAKVRKGRIIRQSRRPGARLPRGTRVNVAVSRGRRR